MTLHPRLHWVSGSLASATDIVDLHPSTAGWTFTALRVFSLAPGVERSNSSGEFEAMVLPLSAEAVTIRCDGEVLHLHGRSSVFARVSDFAYIPRDAEFTIQSETGGEVAVAMARCDERLSVRYGPSGDVPVETRGAGPATRQVTNMMSPDTWPHASKLMLSLIHI